MTTTKEPLGIRLKNDANTAVDGGCFDAYLGLIEASLRIENPVTEFDLIVAMDNLTAQLTSGRTAINLPPIDASDSPPRSESDNRPLYIRIDEEAPEVGKLVRKVMRNLQLIAVLIVNDETAMDYAKVLEDFWAALGVPTREQYNETPDLFPNVGPGVVRQIAEHLGIPVED